MTEQLTTKPATGPATEHVDVLIVGAGLSGIGAAYHLPGRLPRPELRHPRGPRGHRRHLGPVPLSRRPVRLGHAHAGLPVPAVDPGEGHRRRPGDPELRARHRRRGGHRQAHQVRPPGDSARRGRPRPRAGRCGRPTAPRRSSSPAASCSCAAAITATTSGHQPPLPGIEKFGGQIVHPQAWPEDLDYAGKRVVVIGSGATAVTLVPAMAETAAHVTMLQRSPTYILPLPAEDAIANRLRSLIGPRRAYAVTRWKNVAMGTVIYELSQRRPRLVRKLIRNLAVKQLPDGYDVDTHFNPGYNPWDQRLCLIPDGDLYRSISAGAVLGGDRQDRHVHRARPAAGVGSRAARRHRGDRDRAAAARPRRHRADGRRPGRSGCRRRWPTRA